ncbi:hypothetical protein [Streptomyces blattellae]|uniref:hypothetical protein n=1 Tax=Streptomyces blattellae TaxID=2569855 RepID=UPI0012B8D0D9|nr:hypothetical protein [Streptomyces blattellae]
MNIRSLTRGDGVVIGAAVLLFIASFLATYGGEGSDIPNAWDNLGMLMSMYVGGIAGAVLIVVARALPQPRKVVGLELGQVGVALTVFAAWTAFWTIIDPVGSINTDGADVELGSGLILGLIAALLLAAGAIAGPLVPALQAALLPAPRPAAPQPYGAQPPGGYGYPGAGAPQPGQVGQAGQPGQPYGGQPQPGQPYGAQQPQASQPQPAGDFSPFWFAVPVPRPLFAEDGSQTPIAELAPGTWYLAVEQRGPGLVAQTQDGRRGVLQDTSGIQRG